MKIVEVKRCDPLCPYNTMLSLRQMYCQHSNAGKHRAKRINYSKITDKHPFPDWCPLEDKVEEPKYTYTLNCERCGDAYDSDFAFPAKQLCPSCSKNCVVVREDCPDGYWYSNQRGKQFNIKTCSFSDLREVDGFRGKEPNECWKVADGYFAGNVMVKQHCL